MNKLRGMYLFTRVADLGSFAAVAEDQGTTPSMVSKEIQKLEQTVGGRLLHRSTRKVQLTDIGTGYLTRCRDILAHVKEADDFVAQRQNSVQGKLRINAPMVLGMTDLGRALADYMRTFPEVKLDIHLSDDNLDLVEQGFDLGFRASSRPFDSAYVGKPLTAFTYHACAAPQYLNEHPKIKTEEDLQQHNCFVYSYFKGENEWPLGRGVVIDGSLKVNNTLFMRDIIEAGLGIGFLPSFVAQPALLRGRVQEVLPDLERPKLTLYALYPNRKYSPPILAKCIEFLQLWFDKEQSVAKGH